MKFLSFELSETTDGVTTLEAMAATPAAAVAESAAVMAEAQQVLDWAWHHFPQGPGPVDEGHDWDHDLQVGVEDDRWHVVTLTLTGSRRFVAEFFERFGAARA